MAVELPSPNKIYFKNLDSIRFFAALMVFMQHGVSGGYKYLNIKGTVFERFLLAISNGGCGVSMFFVLSGFLITYLILTETELTGSFSLKNFYIRRILRIWPLYFAVILIAFGIFPALSHLLKSPINPGGNPWYQLTFMGNFDVMHLEKLRGGSDIEMQNITWSVAIEEQFYIFWPLIFAFLPRKFILPSILLVIIGSLIFRFYNADDTYVLFFHTLAVMVDLGTGALFAYLIIRSKKVKAFFENMHPLAILASIILLLCSLMFGDIIFSSKSVEFLSRFYYALLFGFIIASQSMLIKPSIIELGNIGFARTLGKYTYGIYLLHPIALELMHIACKLMHLSIDSGVSFFISATCGLILTLFISWLSYEYFEKRFLTLKKSFAVITKE